MTSKKEVSISYSKLALAICELLKAIRLKNPNEDKIYVIMDNASYNRSKKVRNLSKELNIRIKYLTP